MSEHEQFVRRMQAKVAEDRKVCAVCGAALADELAKDAAADELHQQREAGRAAAAGASMLLEASQEMISGAHIWRGALVRYPSSDAPHTIGRVESVAAPDGRGEEYAGQVLIQWPQGSAWHHAARLEVLDPAAAVWVLVQWLHRCEGGADALPGDEYTREVERLAKRHEERNISLARERDALREKVEGLKREVDDLRHDLAKHQRDDLKVEIARRERDQLREKLAIVEEERNGAMADRERLGNELNSANAELRTRQAVINAERTAVYNLTNNNNKAQQAYQKICNERDAATAAMLEALREREQAEQREALASAALDEVRGETVTLASLGDALVKERDALRERVAALEVEAEARAARIVAPQVEVTNAVRLQLESMAGAVRFNAEALTSTGAALVTLEKLVGNVRPALRGGYDTIQVFAEVAGLAIHIAQRVADGTLAGEVPDSVPEDRAMLTLEAAYKLRGERVGEALDRLQEVRDDLEACKADRQRAQAELAQQGARLSQALEDRAVLAARLEEARGDAKMAATQLYDAQAELAENAKELREVRADLKAAAADALQQRQTLEGERALAAREKAALRVELADARHDAAFADMAPDIALSKMLSSLQAGRDERLAAALALVEAEAQRQRVKWGEHVSRAKLHDLLAAEVGLVMMADAGGHVRVRLCKLAALALRAMQTPAPALEVSPAPAAAAPLEVTQAVTVAVPDGVSADEVAARAAAVVEVLAADVASIQPDGL